MVVLELNRRKKNSLFALWTTASKDSMAYSETFLDLINRIQEETVILGDEVLDKMLAIFPGHSYYVKVRY